jgi:hypothetical protein
MFGHENCSFFSRSHETEKLMKHPGTIITATAAALAAVLATAAAYADTSSSDKGRTTMEQKASPSNPVKQDEERTEAHSQPDVPNAGGTTQRNTKKAAPKKSSEAKKDKDKSKDKSSSSSGSSAPAMDAVTEQRFKALDIDGDGSISKAEAAGNADIVKDFDRADRDRDGKLSRAEYGTVGKPRPAKKQAAR